jgi:hypothetical protein
MLSTIKKAPTKRVRKKRITRTRKNVEGPNSEE